MKLSVLLSIFVTVFCIVNYLPTSQGCSCQTKHPQDYYCTAGFVIKAHVRRVKTVQLLPDESIRHIKPAKTGKGKVHIGPEVTTEQPSLGTEKTLNGEDDLDVKPAPFGGPGGFPGPNSPVSPTVESIGNSPGSPGDDSLDGNTDSVEKKRARRHNHPGSDDMMDKLVRNVRDVGLPPGKVGTKVRPIVNLFQYKIDIVKVFKGLGNVTKLGRNFLYTSAQSFLCSKTLKKSTYILMGRVMADRMHISLCDYSLELNDESSSAEKRNLVRNLRERFSRGCENCRVHVCFPFGKCPATRLDSSTCLWEDWLNIDSMEANQHACMQTKKGKCKWYNALKKERKGKAKNVN